MNRIYFLLIAAVIVTSCAKPLAKFTAFQKHPSAPTDVAFNNESTKAETYLWDFGDGRTSTEKNPRHRYVLSGNYKVTLIAQKGKKTSKVEKNINVDAPEKCLLEMETTKGVVTLRLYDNTPQHRDNFIKLAEEGYYDGLLFHRVINGFMIQGGDPDSKGAPAGKRLGMGGPGYQVPAEINKENFHVKGAIAAARTGDAVNPERKSSGSQFYIVHGKPISEQELSVMESRKGIKYTDEAREIYTTQGGVPFLDQDYTVYGIVERGLDIIDNIATTQTDGADRPQDDVKIIKIRVVR